MAAKGISLEDLMELWSKDSAVNIDNLAVESLKNPELHSKYLNYLTYHSMIVKALQSEYVTMRRLKSEYYNGLHNTDKDFLDQYKLEPIRTMILKTDIPLYLESDKDLMPILLKKAVHEEIVDYCRSVLKEIGSRGWTIRNAIEFLKYTQGS